MFQTFVASVQYCCSSPISNAQIKQTLLARAGLGNDAKELSADTMAIS
jgi:hypothetical protein